MRAPLLAAFILSICFPLLAKTQDGCLLNFASVADAANDPTQLVLKTYHELWDQVGGAKVNVATIAAIMAGDSPFHIPEQPGTELHALQNRMKEFEKMVEDRGWTTPQTAAALRQYLAELLKKQDVAVEQQRSAVNTTAAAIRIPFRMIPR